ncbi:MAG TPA: plasma-membrane proton-efflux P-type ATPase [Vicinamibacterales bacterium]|nr:plasma-membrane proton-efflux P-type ATPase [Vicinamibacterales bacterium]
MQTTDSKTPARSATDTILSLGSNRAAGLTAVEATLRLNRDGPNDVPEARIHPLSRLLRKFWGLSAWMLELIVALSVMLGKRVDAWVALGLLLVNAVLSFLQEQRASAAVSALRRRLQVTARVLRDASWTPIPARELVPGDVVRVRAGDFVPADLLILDGDLRVDQSALTGESQEIARTTDHAVFSGSTVRRGEATAIVTATGGRTYFGKTTQLIQTAHPKLHVEEVTTRLVQWLFVIVGVLVSVAVTLSIVQGLRLLDILPLSLVLLMSAVPVALPVMFTVTMAVGSMELARRGALVTHLAAVEDAATMDVLCADKTGTLTMNRLSLTGMLVQPGFTEEDLLRTAAWASNEANQDPIDIGFLRAAAERGLAAGGTTILTFIPFSPETRRTEAVVSVGGRTVRAMKGALRTVSEASGIGPDVIAELEARANEESRKGARVLAVAVADTGGPFKLVGLAFLSDTPRADSRELIEKLQALGVRIKMVTGDALPVALAIAHGLGLGEIVRAPDLRAALREAKERAGDLVAGSDGFAEVFPEDKFLLVKTLQEGGHVVGMTGDGVNDAPALRQAEVGIAVSGATDVAKGAASVVLTTEGLVSIIDLVGIGRATYQRVLTWIINKVSRTILKAGFVVVAFLVTGRFVISALGMVLLVFMTDFVKISLSTDRVSPSKQPESWNIRPLVTVAVVLGLVMLVEALALLAIGWHRFHLDVSGGRLQTFSFVTLLFFALFSIVSIRERRAFWTSRPGWLLVSALAGDACVGLAIAMFGVGELQPLPLALTALIVGYALVCSLGPNDVLKSMLITRLWTPTAPASGAGVA